MGISKLISRVYPFSVQYFMLYIFLINSNMKTHKIYLIFPMILLHKANEKARKMKKAFCFNICSRHSLWQNVSMSDLRISKLPRTKKGNLGEHFSASAYGLGFKNFSLGSLFSTSVTWKNLKSDVDKFCLRRVENKYQNKIVLLGFTRILGRYFI